MCVYVYIYIYIIVFFVSCLVTCDSDVALSLAFRGRSTPNMKISAKP